MGWVLSCETGISKVLIFFRCGEGNIISRGMAMCGMDLAQSETPCTWRRPLCGTWEISFVPDLGSGRFRKATNRTLNMHAGEKSDRAIVPKKRPNNGR